MTVSCSFRKFLPPLYFLVLTLLYLMPLPLHWTTHVPGDMNRGDSVFHTWPFWYFPYALTHGITPLLHPNLQFYPDGIAMLLTNANLVGSILMAPISLTLGVCAAVNTWLLLQLWIGGWMFFLLMRRLDISSIPAYIAGTAYACSPFVTTHLVGHYTLVCIGFPAAILYCGLRLYQTAFVSWKTRIPITIVLGLLWVALAITDFYLTVMTVFLFTGLMAHLAWRDGMRSFLQGRIFISLGVAASLSIICISPVALELHHERAGQIYEHANIDAGSDQNSDFITMLSPPRHHWIQLIATGNPFSYNLAKLQEWESGYIGFSFAIIAVISLCLARTYKSSLVWIVLCIVFFALIGGNSYTENSPWKGTPLAIGSLWPKWFPLGEFRMPNRWTFCMQVGLIIIGAMALNQCRIVTPKRSKLFISISIFLLIADLFRPPVIAPNGPEQTKIPSTELKSGTVIDLNVSLWSGNGYLSSQFDLGPLRRQMFHGRAILSVCTARLSRNEFEARMADPEFKALIDLQGTNKSGVAPEIPDLDWVGFAKRYDITTIRIPGDYRHKEVFKTLGERMLPGIMWAEYPGEIIGNRSSRMVDDGVSSSPMGLN